MYELETDHHVERLWEGELDKLEQEDSEFWNLVDGLTRDDGERRGSGLRPDSEERPHPPHSDPDIPFVVED